MKMIDAYIQYVIPENSKVFFLISPKMGKVTLKLLDGVADMYVKDKDIRLPLKEDFIIQFNECLCSRLKTKTGCSFLVRGCHYVSSAIQHGLAENTFFSVSGNKNSFSFNLEKDIQLQIFPLQSTEPESSITIKSTRGAPEISGFILSLDKTYHLSPYFPVLLKSSNGKPYSIFVRGISRIIKLSVLDQNHNKLVNSVKYDFLYSKFLLEKEFECRTVLVVGPRNVGKTSFCQVLMNLTLAKKMTPVYVDLNVKRNMCVPGSLSLSEIESQVGSSIDFKYNTKKLLHFGSVDIHSFNVRFYNKLLRKMGELLSSHLNYNRKENYLCVIDTDGSHLEHNTAIELLLNSFPVDVVVYIGDIHYYSNLRDSILRRKQPVFIPKPHNTEQLSDSYEARYYQHRIQKYFFSSTAKSSAQNICTVAFHDIAIYRIWTLPNVNSDYGIERMYINPTMLNNLFGVSAAERVDFNKITEIKYYVHFIHIDMAAQMAFLKVPESETFSGGILLIGPVLKLDDSEVMSKSSITAQLPMSNTLSLNLF